MTSRTIGSSAAHRHTGTRARQDPDEPLADEEIHAAVRRWEVRCLTEEMHFFGLEPPIGLRCLLDLFTEGRATSTQIQAYLDGRLAAHVFSLPTEAHHA